MGDIFRYYLYICLGYNWDMTGSDIYIYDVMGYVMRFDDIWSLKTGYTKKQGLFLIGDSRDSLRQKPSRESRVSPVISPVDVSLW